MKKFNSSIIPTVAAASLSLLGLCVADLPQKLVWNSSPSAPPGLYRVVVRTPQIGEFALIAPTENINALLLERGYLPPNTPMIKRVAGGDGDEVCRAQEKVFVNGIHMADAQSTDSMGRAMPEWSGCVTLQPDEVFLLNPPEKSLDSRYFGALKLSSVTGVAIPVFVRGPSE